MHQLQETFIDDDIEEEIEFMEEEFNDPEDADLVETDHGPIEGEDSEVQTEFIDDSIMSFSKHERKIYEYLNVYFLFHQFRTRL